MQSLSFFGKTLLLLILLTQIPLFAGNYFIAISHSPKTEAVNKALVSKMEPNDLNKALLLLHAVSLAFACAVAFLLQSLKEKETRRQLQSAAGQLRREIELKHFNEWTKIAKKLSHEIKNPLTPIEMTIGNLVRNHELLEHDAFSQKLAMTHSVISEEVNKMGKLLNDFSRFSKLPACKMKAVTFYTFLTHFVEEQQASHPQVSFEFTADEKSKTKDCLMDEQLIHHCLKNIVDNAREALSENNKPKVSIKLSVNSSKLLSLVIQNPGTTLTETQRDHIFDIYYTTKSHSHNLGLGLSIAKKIMLEHGGDCCCLPDKNGVTILMTLPSIQD